MSTSSTASARVQFGLEIVEVKGYKLQTTIDIYEMFWALRSSASEGISRARMPMEN